MSNQMQLKFLSRSENEVFARNVVAAFALPLNPTLSELSDVKTAVSEAVTNCIVHAYAGGEGWIVLDCETQGRTLHITVSDSGRGARIDSPRGDKPRGFLFQWAKAKITE